MSFTIRKAVREGITVIGVFAGPTGSGKTFSALEFAMGLAGKKRVGVVDTESRRATHYADHFDFDHLEIDPPFAPMRYLEAIESFDPKTYGCLVIDQFSHEHAGDGGLLDMHEAALDKMAGDNWQKREACKMAAWVKPKGDHKRLVNAVLRLPFHLIFCLRAEEKIEMVKGRDGKWEIQPKKSAIGLDGWMPICEKNLPYEATCSFLFTADAPGVPKPIKLQEQHKAFFPLERKVTRAAGEQLARWAAGETTKVREALPAKKDDAPAPSLADVRRAIEEAKTNDDMLAAAELAKKLGDKDRKDKDLRAAFKAKADEITKAQAPRERQPGED